MKSFLKRRISQRSRGFTLIEMLMTLVIFSIMTGVVLVNQDKFDSTILLNNLAYDVAITIRQAQTYGVNVREFRDYTGLGQFVAYGVKFAANQNKSFVLFADADSNKQFDGDFDCPQDDTECVERYAIKRGNIIQSICAGPNADECDKKIDSLTILFKRPDPDAMIMLNSNGEKKAFAKIVISTPNEAKKSIIVRSTGQIYVE